MCSVNRWGSYMLWSDLAFECYFYLWQLDSQIPSKWSTYYKKCWQGQCQSGSLFLVIPWWLKVRMPNSLLFCSKCSIDSMLFFSLHVSRLPLPLAQEVCWHYAYLCSFWLWESGSRQPSPSLFYQLRSCWTQGLQAPEQLRFTLSASACWQGF